MPPKDFRVTLPQERIAETGPGVSSTLRLFSSTVTFSRLLRESGRENVPNAFNYLQLGFFSCSLIAPRQALRAISNFTLSYTRRKFQAEM